MNFLVSTILINICLTVLAWRKGWKYHAVSISIISLLLVWVLAEFGSSLGFLIFIVQISTIIALSFMVAKSPANRFHRRLATGKKGTDSEDLLDEIERLNKEIHYLKESKKKVAPS
jgi:hypothetical protein